MGSSPISCTFLVPIQRPVVVQKLNADVALLERRGHVRLRVLTDEGCEGALGALKVRAEPLEYRGRVKCSLCRVIGSLG